MTKPSEVSARDITNMNATNITSDSTITMIVAHTEAEVDESVLSAS